MKHAHLPVPDGTPVTYHGSITAAHGRWIAQVCDCDRCWALLTNPLSAGLTYPLPRGLVLAARPRRFQLVDPQTGRVQVEHVRRASIDPDPAS